MRTTSLVLALTLVAHCAHAGTRSQTPLSFRALSEGTPEAAAVKDQVRQLRIRWTVAPALPPAGNRPAAVPSAVPSLVVISEQSIAGSIRRQRQPQVTTDQLVVVQRGADGRALDWSLIPNPRVVRAEVPGADGRLTGRTVRRDDVELLVIVTPMPNAITLAVYQPRWTGTEHVLELIGEAALPRMR